MVRRSKSWLLALVASGALLLAVFCSGGTGKKAARGTAQPQRKAAWSLNADMASVPFEDIPAGFKYAGGIIVVVLLAYWILSWLVGCMAKRAYAQIKAGNAFDMDTYVGDPNPSGKSCVKMMLGIRLNVGYRTASQEAIPLAEALSPFVKGLHVTSRLGTGATSRALAAAAQGQAIVVGTIRMGFGHHRIAYAAASWGVASGRNTYFHDFLNIDSQEAQLIRDTDKLYSKGSRLASELGGPIERLWGAATKSGDANMLRATYQMAEHLKPLLLDIDKDTPIIATHSLVGLVAIACGFKRVINLVIDNHAQWFCVVPGALNLVQGPSNYHNFLKMGVPASQLRLAGHWIPKDLVDNIDADCGRRKERLQSNAPRRLLIPVGGAGAQRKFVTSFVVALGERVRAGKVRLFLNAADHAHMKEAFLECLNTMRVEYTTIDSLEGVQAFCEKLHKGAEPEFPVTLFAFPSYFPAVATTDLVSRVSDVLCSKPSELAFYPVPKLNIRRVGDHEAYSALRSSELGDGSLEVRELSEAMRYVELFEGSDLLRQLNDCIMQNASIGAYNGCKTAVEIASGKQGW